MARFEAVPDLDAIVARMVAPEVRKIAEDVTSTARRLAPPGKRWVSMADNVVRDTHRAAHGLPQIPGNLRFSVPKQEWDADHGLGEGGGIDHLLKPKDTSTGLPLDSVQHVHCRCILALDPAAIASRIKTGPTEVIGSLVRIVVSCDAYKVVQAEYGETYGANGVHSPGVHFMGRAASRAAGNGGGYGVIADPSSWGGAGAGTGSQDNHG